MYILTDDIGRKFRMLGGVIDCDIDMIGEIHYSLSVSDGEHDYDIELEHIDESEVKE